jgi:hypothetical protein
MIIGINALNVNSGGGIQHLAELVINISKIYPNTQIIIWSDKIIQDKIPETKNIKFRQVNLSYVSKFFWKIIFLKKEILKEKCDIIFYSDGIIIGKQPVKAVLMYQNLIPFNFREIIKYGFSLAFFKLLIIRLFYIFSSSRADGVIFLNKFGYNYIKKIIHIKKNYSIISHGVSKKFYINVEKRKIKNLIYISTIDRYKNQIELVKAINNINLFRNYDDKINLHLIGGVGNYDYYSSLNKLIDGNSNIIFYGNLEHEKILKMLLKMDLYIFASSCESMGLSLLEGMATSLPVLCSDKSGLKSTMNFKTVFFNPESSTDTKDKILLLINNKKEILRNSKLSTEQAKNFTWEACAIKTFIFFKKIISQTKILPVKKKSLKNTLIELFDNNNLKQIVYSINFFTPTFVWVINYLFLNKSNLIDYVLLSSLLSFSLTTLSFHSRNLSIVFKNLKKFNSLISLRVFFSFIVIIPLYFIVFHSKIYHFDLSIIDFFLIYFFFIIFWLNELIISFLELNKFKKILKNLFFFQIFSSFLTLFLSSIDYGIFKIIFILVLFYLIFFSYLVFNNILKKISFKIDNSIKLMTINNFLSNFFITLSGLVIKILVSRNFNEELALNIMFSFTVGTFLGTLFVNTYGINYIKNLNIFPVIPKIILYIYFIMFLLSLTLLVSIEFFNFYQVSYYKKFIYLFNFSLVGSMFLLVAQIVRLTKFNEKKELDILFYDDIVYSVFSVLIVYIFCSYQSINYELIFLTVAICSLYIYLVSPTKKIKQILN